MTRTESRHWKMELLRYVSEKCGLVCGSETGHDASVPYVHYFEGMLSLGPYRVPDSGRRMADIVEEVPERVAKFQTGHVYRLPLWELVYHDCVVAQWYWGDYNNKLPSLWDRRDLFNALYGTPPMFMFRRDQWEKNRERFVQQLPHGDSRGPRDRLLGDALAPLADRRPCGAANRVRRRRHGHGELRRSAVQDGRRNDVGPAVASVPGHGDSGRVGQRPTRLRMLPWAISHGNPKRRRVAEPRPLAGASGYGHSQSRLVHVSAQEHRQDDERHSVRVSRPRTLGDRQVSRTWETYGRRFRRGQETSPRRTAQVPEGVAEHFPDECRYVLEALKVVYKNDAVARQENLSPEARLQFHKDQSCPVMDDLNAWLQRQIEDRLVEPNSGLGEALTYLLKHWGKFTLFLRQPGAPLDNNLCERALKKVILHRKNAMFYKTENGAHAGDLYLSLIYTCELCGANPFDYLTELQRHAGEVAANPACWMPWNYRQTLAVVPAATSPAATATSDLLASVP